MNDCALDRIRLTAFLTNFFYCMRKIKKDVVIIGNGPSAIFLSSTLSGNLPYDTQNLKTPLTDQNLTKICQKKILKGRS